MANQNPIRVDQPDVPIAFNIPAANANDAITLTIKIDLTAEGWAFQPSAQVFLNGNDIFPQSTPEPVNLKLGTGNNLKGKTLGINASVMLVFTAGGFSGTLPVYQYSIILMAGNTPLQTFTASSANNNPTNFNSQTLFQ